MMRGLGWRSRLGPVMLAALVTLALAPPAGGQVKLRVVVVLPYDASALEAGDRWMGEGVAQALTLGLAQHAAFVPIDRARLRALGAPDAWGDAGALQAARALRAEAALFGRFERRGADVVVLPRLLEVKGGVGEPVALEAVTVPEGELLARVAVLPIAYARALRVPLTDAETARIERAARPTRSLRAFEFFARGQTAALAGGQQNHEAAVDLLSRAIEADSSFVVAHHALGLVHQTLGNRWKAAAQFRASTQLDAAYPEPFKALGDLFLAAPRRLFDQAVEAYNKAIELRPFYADAHVGLGDAKAAKGDVDGAVAAYQRALVFNPVNPRVHLSLGKIFYGEKGLYYESVTAYKKAIDLDANSLEARMGLGEVYEDKGLYREAIEEYRKVIEMDAKHTGALYNLALVYEKVDPREAVVQWERYIQLASGLPTEKDWVDVARAHLRKLKNRLKD
ncbi:MAG: tetratricopeptide repeat protein [Candidatus Rokubacteria bacterium]|nr:tetratricopeptide repeat protein [Candidatus Rokubacteria bacterium]